MTKPTTVPREIFAGETVSWQPYFEDYSSSDGWALACYFRGPGKLDVAGVAQEDGSFLVTAAASYTAELAAGVYYWQAWVELDGEKYMAASGECLVKPSLAGEVESYDGRSAAKKTLDAIDALLAGKATLDQQQYSIAGGGGYRMLSRIPITDLLLLRKECARRVMRDDRNKRVKRGGTLFSSVKVRFNEPR